MIMAQMRRRAPLLSAARASTAVLAAKGKVLRDVVQLVAPNIQLLAAAPRRRCKRNHVIHVLVTCDRGGKAGCIPALAAER